MSTYIFSIRSKDATRAPGLATRNKKLLGTKGIATWSKDAYLGKSVGSKSLVSAGP